MLAFLAPLLGTIGTKILGWLGNIPGMIGDYFKDLHELKKIQLDTQKAIEMEKLKMAAETAKAQLELNKTIVASTGSYFKYFTFVMWFGPFMIGLIAPEYSQIIFNNLGAMPQWYVESCIMIMFTVWGISVSAPVVAGIFSGLGKFFSDRRDYKLARAGLDKKLIFDVLRKIQGPLSQAQVDLANNVMSKEEE